MIGKSRKLRGDPEGRVHIPVLNWIRKHVTHFVWHTPNEGFRGMWEAFDLKAKGVRSGVPDLMFVVRGQVYFLEIKHEHSSDRSGSVNQKTFGREAIEAGAHWACVWSKDMAIAQCVAWGLVPADGEMEAA